MSLGAVLYWIFFVAQINTTLAVRRQLFCVTRQKVSRSILFYFTTFCVLLSRAYNCCGNSSSRHWWATKVEEKWGKPLFSSQKEIESVRKKWNETALFRELSQRECMQWRGNTTERPSGLAVVFESSLTDFNVFQQNYVPKQKNYFIFLRINSTCKLLWIFFQQEVKLIWPMQRSL